ncbi:helix-turn-helix transcriptional regulator [Micromonospora sp. WMMC241]|uniref:helix-turn-helix domain-containing protein n=1 Tax=Micromonospora sp. WMMC241 TaxID=3015159 RepID=UPI0022B64001|nr:helix-turn-helix transcriptional regulator [Micromonospora sp. WMMC241]MCZ7440453.1 helix-turn-helix transcriptional regulator [Micromonospora sp. WMMC241]
MPASFWEHEPVRLALAGRHLGRAIRAYRNHPYQGRSPLPQSVVAAWLGITQAQLSRVENGPPIVHLDRLIHWARLLRIPSSHLWFTLPGQLSAMPTAIEGSDHDSAETLETAGAAHPPVPADAATSASERGGGTTDRRQFHALAALAGIAATGFHDLLSAPAEAPRSVGMEQVRYAGSLVEQLRQADAVAGADQLYDIAVRVHSRLSSWATKATYSREAGEALQIALADLAIATAWLAIDSENRPMARPYLNEAITRARIADDPRLEVLAFAQLALLVRDDHPAESLHSAQAALRASAGWGTPRLATLVHLRTAHAFAALRDVSGFSRAMTKARREFERGTSEDDMPFLHFVTAQEVQGIEGLSYLAMGRAERAADAFRATTESTPPALRRNRIYYTVQLADAQCRLGDVNEAARTAMAVLPDLSQVSSGRVWRDLTRLRSSLTKTRQPTATSREFIDAYDQAVSR